MRRHLVIAALAGAVMASSIATSPIASGPIAAGPFAAGLIAAVHAAQPTKSRRAVLPKGYTQVDGIVAVVGKRIITRTALVRALAQHGRSQQMVPTEAERPRSDDDMLRQVLDVLIENELVLSAARELGLTVSDAEIDAELAKLKRKNVWDNQELRENVRRLGFAGVGEYRESIRTEKLRIKMLRTKLGSRLRITEAEVKRVMDVKYKGGTIEEEVRGRHVLVKIPPGAGPMQVNKLRSKAWRIWDMVQAGGKSFAEIAEEHSDDVGTQYGGDLGFMRRWMLDPTFARTLWGLKKKGDVSKVIQTPFGFHIVQLVDRRMAPAKDKRYIEQMVRGLLTEQAFLKLYRNWIGELRQTRHIELRLK